MDQTIKTSLGRVDPGPPCLFRLDSKFTGEFPVEVVGTHQYGFHEDHGIATHDDQPGARGSDGNHQTNGLPFRITARAPGECSTGGQESRLDRDRTETRLKQWFEMRADPGCIPGDDQHFKPTVRGGLPGYRDRLGHQISPVTIEKSGDFPTGGLPEFLAFQSW